MVTMVSDKTVDDGALCDACLESKRIRSYLKTLKIKKWLVIAIRMYIFFYYYDIDDGRWW